LERALGQSLSRPPRDEPVMPLLAALLIIGAYLHPATRPLIPIIIIVALLGAIPWLCRNRPMTVIFLLGFIRGLFGRRRW
jgi:hypothetical protein